MLIIFLDFILQKFSYNTSSKIITLEINLKKVSNIFTEKFTDFDVLLGTFDWQKDKLRTLKLYTLIFKLRSLT